MSNRLFIIDGQSFCYRAFYAIRQLSNSKGEPTNAIYGFVAMLRKIIREQNPGHLAVCFDRAEKTFRKERFEKYKEHRKPMPDALVEQIPHIKQILTAYRIPIYEKAGFEADDLMGTIAKQAEKKGFEVFLATSDKDVFQLMNKKVKIFNPGKEEYLDLKSLDERFPSLKPEQVVEVFGLAGDPSDNIPGVKGIGEKTAIELIQEFGSVEGVYKNLERVHPESKRKKLADQKEIAMESRALAVIDCEVPFDFNFDDMAVKEPDMKELLELFRRFEFRTLIKECAPVSEADRGKRDYRIVREQAGLEALAKKLGESKLISVDTETTSEDPFRAYLVGISFSMDHEEAYYVAVSSDNHTGPGIPLDEVRKALASVLSDRNVAKCGQNIKYDYIVLKRHGMPVDGIVFDTMVASYLANPIKLNHNLDDITLECLNFQKISYASLVGSGKNKLTMDQVALEKIAEYAAEDADCVFRLVPFFEKQLKGKGVYDLFLKVEMPLVEVLAKMEMNGVALDCRFLEGLSAQLQEDLDRLSENIYKEAGEQFNINSTRQLSEILFTKLKLPVIKRTKTGFSTDVSVLERLAQTYKLPKLLLEYREKTKLKSTYVDALPSMVHPETQCIHTSFNQTVTATGRLSSSDPNLQNIPIKTELGRQIRRAFVAREKGRKIFSADYSQIELRILAHYAQDRNLMKAFQDDLDVHTFTATLLYGVKDNDVTREMRNAAKTINFSIVYGVSAFGLAQSLEVSMPEAQKFIDSYFDRYPGIRRYLETQKEKAKAQGYLETILGRRSYFPDIQSSNPMARQFAERAAINAPIQGSAADMIKVAMIGIQQELEKRRMKSLMVLQVHDELVFDALDSELEELEILVKDRMEKAVPLDVPLRVDAKIGESWYHE